MIKANILKISTPVPRLLGYPAEPPSLTRIGILISNTDTHYATLLEDHRN